MSHRIPIEKLGQFAVSPLVPCEVGSFASFELCYVVGPFGMDDKGSVRFVFHGAKDYSEPQFSDPTAPGYTTVEISSGVSADIGWSPFLNERPWFNTLEVRLQEGGLKPGDEIRVRLGDRREGSPGFQMQTYCQDRFKFRALVNPFSTQQFFEVGEMPHLEVIAGPGETWKAVLPTQRRPGDEFSLGIKCEDYWGNPSHQVNARLCLSANMAVTGLPEHLDYRHGQFSKRLDGLSVAEDGDLIVELRSDDGTRLASSNPLRIRRDAPYRHYWADLHGQTEETIGTNTATRYFEFARDKAFLDACGHQGNDIQISNAFWKELNDITRTFDQPGRFLAVPGYEWSANSSVGGDRNIWYRHEDRPIYRAHRALVTDDDQSRTDCHDAHALFSALRREDVVVAAHCGGRYADIGYAHDGRSEHAVEVHSAWGTFEWLLEDALKAGYRIGVVGNSDGHKGRPGASYPGRSFFTAMGGLTCFLMEKLHRDDLFEAMRRRHAYATTGVRLVLDVSAAAASGFEVYDRDPYLFGDDARATPSDIAIMGDIARVAPDTQAVTLKIAVCGNEPIERIDLYDGLDLLETVFPNGTDSASRRVRLLWQGARYRGRGRNARWTGELTVEGNVIERAEDCNFLTPTIRPEQVSNQEITIDGLTAGGAQGVDLWLRDADAGHLSFNSNQGAATFEIGDLSEIDRQVSFGGLGLGVRAFRLPEVCAISDVSFERIIPVRSQGDTRLYARITQMDGHQAWSSPIYLFRQAARKA